MARENKKPAQSSGAKAKNKKTQATAKSTSAVSASQPVKRSVLDDICAILLIAVGAFLVVAFQTDAAGTLGTALSNGFKGCFGAIAFMIPYYLIIYGVLLLARKTIPVSGKSAFLVLLILLMCTLLNSARFIDPEQLRFGLGSVGYYFGMGIDLESGGLFGMCIGSLIVKAIGVPGLYIFSVVTIIIALLLVINTPISQFFEHIAERRQRKRELEELEAAKTEEELLAEATEPTPPKQKKRNRNLHQTIPENLMEFPDYKLQEKNGKNVFEIPAPKEKYSKVRDARSEETSYVPGHISKGQQNILDYMKSDTLYGISMGHPDFEEQEHEPEMEIDTASDFELGEYGFCSAPQEEESFFSKHRKEEDELVRNVVSQPEPKSEVSFQEEKAKLTNSEASKAVLSQKEMNLDVPAADQYRFPSLELLHKAKGAGRKIGVDHTLQNKARKLEQTLQNFHIDARVIQVTQGPAITRYEIQPNVGVKVKSIVNLADDIALNLEAKSIRIEAPIPGKAAVGIEVENDKVNMVTLREIIDTEEFRKSKSKITFAVGKDIAGKAIVSDLKAMPHLLIAGSTGSGKSVCVNSIIASILYKARPDEVKLVLIDPKVVELANYNGIPHLLIPVVTEPSKAAAALNWAVAEMDDRYKKFAAEGVRDLESYNNTVKKRGDDDLFLPQVVIIIDELADLMMAAPSQVEESICRLAQKARAAGMHLIVATQRPSVDIITGVIKANIPSRIAFAVSSQFDSRTILDMAGAEKLVGKGDMLFNPMGGGKPHRVQGTFISDEEVHDVIEFIKGQTEDTEYSSDVLHTIERANTPDHAADEDELLAEAIETVVLAGSASVSMLQRRFRVGYNRAARMIDMMENRGIIGPSEGSKPRQVLMTEAELYNLQKETEGMEES